MSKRILKKTGNTRNPNNLKREVTFKKQCTNTQSTKSQPPNHNYIDEDFELKFIYLKMMIVLKDIEFERYENPNHFCIAIKFPLTKVTAYSSEYITDGSKLLNLDFFRSFPIPLNEGVVENIDQYSVALEVYRIVSNMPKLLGIATLPLNKASPCIEQLMTTDGKYCILKYKYKHESDAKTIFNGRLLITHPISGAVVATISLISLLGTEDQIISTMSSPKFSRSQSKEIQTEEEKQKKQIETKEDQETQTENTDFVPYDIIEAPVVIPIVERHKVSNSEEGNSDQDKGGGENYQQSEALKESIESRGIDLLEDCVRFLNENKKDDNQKLESNQKIQMQLRGKHTVKTVSDLKKAFEVHSSRSSEKSTQSTNCSQDVAMQTLDFKELETADSKSLYSVHPEASFSPTRDMLLMEYLRTDVVNDIGVNTSVQWIPNYYYPTVPECTTFDVPEEDIHVLREKLRQNLNDLDEFTRKQLPIN